MGLFKTVLKQILEEGTVLSKEKISEAAFKIRIENRDIMNVSFIPGYFLRVAIGITEDTLSREDFVRSYSVWSIDRNHGTMDVAIATYSKGAGASWVKQLKPGDKVFFRWKKGKFLLDKSADSYLMIGDLSALSHLYMIRRNLPSTKQVESVIYSEHFGDLYPDIDGSGPLSFYEMPQNPIEQMIPRIQEVVPKMTGKKMVYVGGDSRVCVTLNHYFRKELNWQTSQIRIKPFWNPEKKGLE